MLFYASFVDFLFDFILPPFLTGNHHWAGQNAVMQSRRNTVPLPAKWAFYRVF